MKPAAGPVSLLVFCAPFKAFAVLLQAPLDHIPFVIVGAQVAIKGDKSQASYGQVHLAELGNALFGELVKGHLALVRAPCNCEKAENCNR